MKAIQLTEHPKECTCGTDKFIHYNSYSNRNKISYALLCDNCNKIYLVRTELSNSAKIIKSI